MGARPGVSHLRAAAPVALRADDGHHGPDWGRARQRMVERLAADGIRDPGVLAAMGQVPRHLFIESALRNRAYQDVALPIGHGQTISTPSIVARIIELAVAPLPVHDRGAARVLEIGTGCGYQAAVLAQVFGEVVSIERVGALHQDAASRLSGLRGGRVRLVHADGHEGLPGSAPFHAIVLAAALDNQLPEALLHLLRVGARLVAPLQTDGVQRLVVVDRASVSDWHVAELDTVRFVPMLGGLA